MSNTRFKLLGILCVLQLVDSAVEIAIRKRKQRRDKDELENGLTVRDRVTVECSKNKEYSEGQAKKKGRITSRNRDMYGVVESWFSAYCFDRLVYYKKGASYHRALKT